MIERKKETGSKQVYVNVYLEMIEVSESKGRERERENMVILHWKNKYVDYKCNIGY